MDGLYLIWQKKYGMLKKKKIESSRTSSKRVQKTQFCIVFKPVNPGDCEGVVQFNAVITGTFTIKAVKFCFVPLDGVIIRSGAKKHRNYTPVML